ncbi:TIGR03943 family putative permease subunit [Nakamurella sp.]|uniref:TIGR03943 family putative permease subunit n=1 Tax=Nakamurella sp. TaxID=1869182 RepID=UPI003B3B5AC2
MATSTGTETPAPRSRRRLRLGGMNVETQSIIVTLLGGLLISITVSGRFTSYVRPGFKWLLLISGAILVVVGIVSLVLAVRADMKKHEPAHEPDDAGGCDDAGGSDGADEPDGADAHGHDHASSKAPWLILVPVLVLLLVAPPALGADAVARNAGSQGLAGYDAAGAGGTGTAAKTDVGGKDGTTGVSGGYAFNDGSGSVYDSSGGRRTMHFDPLQGTDPQLTMKDFVLRSLYDADRSLDNGTPVTVTGFLAPAGDGFDSGFTIARMSISCCAADANPLQLHVDGEMPYPSNTWVQAVVVNVPNTGTLDNDYVPTVTVQSMQTIDQPDDPYEH